MTKVDRGPIFSGGVKNAWFLHYQPRFICGECGFEWHGEDLVNGVKYRSTRFLKLKWWITNKILFSVLDGKEYR